MAALNFSASIIVSLTFALIFCFCTCQERQLVAEVNPGCPHSRCNDTAVEVIHVRAHGPNDTIHYVWCFNPKPTVLIALTSHATNLSVSWEDFPIHEHSIYFLPEPPHYSFGVLINQIFEFNDLNDTGLLNMNNNSKSYIQKIDLPESWELKNYVQNQDSVLLVMDGSWKKQSSFVKDGIFRVELETYRKQDHGSKLPHLLHSSNATQIELSFLKMLTKSGFQRNRFAVEIIMAANESSESNILAKSFKSMDDEHTPGVFSLVDLQTTASKESGRGGYLQWRPVAYVAEERDIVNSTETAFYPVKPILNSSTVCVGTLFSAFFGSELNSNLFNAVNVSFGAKDDGFYSKGNVSIWALTVGYGQPPDETFSMMIILIMSICLGLPAVIIVLSGLFLTLRRLSYRKDDLLLSD